jgi:hypothetical protein
MYLFVTYCVNDREAFFRKLSTSRMTFLVSKACRASSRCETAKITAPPHQVGRLLPVPGWSAMGQQERLVPVNCVPLY